MPPLPSRPRPAARLRSPLAALAVVAALAAVAATGARAGEAATQQLFAAVQANDFAAVQQAIGAGADVEARSPWGTTAAEMAVDKGYFRIAHYLVSIRNFQRPREAAAGGQPPLPATPPPGSGGSGEPAARAALGAAGGRPAVTPPSPPPSPGAAVPATRPPAAGGGDPFDPARPVYGSGLPGGDGKGF